MLDENVRRLLDESVLCWLATSSAAGQPSVSPKEVFAAFKDDSVIIANIASPGSARNIGENPHACLSFINIFTQKGYQVSGPATILRAGNPDYHEAQGVLLRITEGNFPFKVVFRVTAQDVRAIIAPRYRLYPDTTEQDQVASAMRAYGVRAID